jgi:TolB-like protein/tetratricopeptide (TPR) repeat protein
LKRRRVVRAVVGWGILSFAVLQVYEPVMHGLHLPEWTLTLVVVVLGVGFPATFVLAWIFDMGPGGVERTPSTPATPATPARRVRTGALLVGLGLLISVPGWLWYASKERAPATDRPGATGTAPAQPAPGAAPGPSIAVLPFADMSEKRDQEYFADGVAEEILNALAQVDGLRVPGRTSSFWFKGKNVELAEIGRKLNVDHVLEGSVRRAGQRVRVTAQVVSVADGGHIWSETFERDQSDIFAVQDQVAKAVVEAMKGRLQLGGARAGGRPPTAKFGAYDQYLLGTQLIARYTREDFRRAISALEKAVSLDPGMAPAWAGLSQALVLFGDNFDVPEDVEIKRRAIEAAERAVSLDPGLAEGHAARAVTRLDWQWRYPDASRDSERALTLAPRSPFALLNHAYVTRSAGRFDESFAAVRKAIEVDPLSARAWNQLTWTAIATGDLAEARAANDRALELAPGSLFVQSSRCNVDFLQGMRDAAREHCEAISDEDMRRFWRAMQASEWGTPGEAQETLADFVAHVGSRDPGSVAKLYAWRGDSDRAMEWLERAHRRRVALDEVKVDYFFRNIASDPRFKALLRKMNLPVD